MIVLVAALAGLAVWLAVTPSPRARLLSITSATEVRPVARRDGRAVRVASVLAGLAAWLLLGGLLGAVVGLACLLVLPRALARLESRADRQRREALQRQAPLLADLLAATLASGATLRAALAAVAPAIGEPTASSLRPVVAAIDLGAEPMSAWRAATAADAHAELIATMTRAMDSGAPLSTVLSRLADDLRRRHRVEVEVAARSAGVRAVAPLAACFLPAFLLLGVVPVIVSLAGALLGR